MAGIAVEVRDQPVEFLLRWAAVALLVFANELKPLQSDAGEVNRLDLYGQTVHGGRVRQNELDHPDIDAKGDRTCALRCPVATEANEPLAIEGRHIALSELPLQQFKCGRLGSQRSLADVAHVVDMKIDEFPNVFRRAMRDSFGASPRSTWRSASMAQRRASSRRRKVSLTQRPLRRTWTRQDPKESFVKVAIFRVRSVCDQPSKRDEKRRITACFRVRSVRPSDLLLKKKQ
ncbi:hypothetical protein IED13_01985 [Bosea sp. SSUT16]|uniref:Uncharacterized protein n=1 Tax=Bosea spartocytisi TaxID=2773451 RepID=A0A927HZL1_9HYPH|nr:hypothetical protein [Bosea spartocytisi]MBD3844453.1 hypothetical protein [Bosea spartocytisi]MCT4470441.1 hypothetical protein [Bosea spartocytisi]